MKSRLPLQFSALLALLIVSPGLALAQKGAGAGSSTAQAGTGMDSRAAYSSPQAPPGVDPITGLPVPRLLPEWKDPEWKDPAKVLTNVFFEEIPLSEVVRVLGAEFKDTFDVLIPHGWSDPAVEPFDPNSFVIKLQLRNVTASEVFNAMNMIFEAENAPLRWELRMNGKRPVAIVRVIPERLSRNPNLPTDPATGLPLPGVTSAPAPEPKRTIQFVGDLIGDGKSTGMTMEQVVKTLSEVWQMTYGQSGAVQFHKDAQLVIVTGTPAQVEFAHQTIRELRLKVLSDRAVQRKADAPQPKSDSKPGSPAGLK